jgi:hypothetical protein
VVGFSPAAMAMPSRMLLSLGCVVIGKALEVGMKFLREDLSSIYKSINSRKSEILHWKQMTRHFSNHVIIPYSLRFGKRSRFGQDLNQTLGIQMMNNF